MADLEKREVSAAELVAAEEELRALKEKYGMDTNEKKGIISKLFDILGEREPVLVDRKKYLLLNVFLGFAGGHRFYSKRYILGVLYLAFCWTGFSIAMSIIDIMIALPKPVDEDGKILI